MYSYGLTQLEVIVDSIEGADFINTPVIQSLIVLRNELMELGFDKLAADSLVSVATISLPLDIFDDKDDKETVLRIIKKMAKAIHGMREAIKPEIESWDLFLNMCKDIKIEIS